VPGAMKQLFLSVNVLLAGFGAALCSVSAEATAERNDWPVNCIIRPGDNVLLLGDSIIAPGMYGYVANSLLDRTYPDSGVTFYSFGIAGTTVESILPHLADALKGREYDWILLNFGHNDAADLRPKSSSNTARD
jgi:hypothetical protein